MNRNITLSRKILAFCWVVLTSGFLTLWAEKKVVQCDPLRITVDDSFGTFSLAVTDSVTGKWVSLLESAEHGSLSGLYIQNGNTVRRLTASNGVKVSSDCDDTSASLTFTVEGKYMVTLRLEAVCVNSKKGYEGIRADVSVQNMSDTDETYSVRAVFDTWLGEQTDTHFTTASESDITTERMYDSMSKAQYIRSAGRGNAIQFLLYGADISVPRGVYITNRDALIQEVWVPQIKEFHTFDSIETYNNSAIGVNWRQISLSPQTKSNFRMYITVASGGKNPGTVKSLGLEESTKVVSVETGLPTYTDSYGTVYTMTAITREQLDPAYISDLLYRISELEKDSDNVTRDEIRKLNAELDAIFEKLEQASY